MRKIFFMDVDFIIHKLTKYINEPLDCTTRNVYCSLFECFIKKRDITRNIKNLSFLRMLNFFKTCRTIQTTLCIITNEPPYFLWGNLCGKPALGVCVGNASFPTFTSCSLLVIKNDRTLSHSYTNMALEKEWYNKRSNQSMHVPKLNTSIMFLYTKKSERKLLKLFTMFSFFN